MKNGSTLRVGLDVHKESIAVAYAGEAGTDPVYVGEIGSEQHQERTVMGPVVNLAARLQAKAEPGQILVGEATYRQAQRSFGFDRHHSATSWPVW